MNILTVYISSSYIAIIRHQSERCGDRWHVHPIDQRRSLTIIVCTPSLMKRESIFPVGFTRFLNKQKCLLFTATYKITQNQTAVITNFILIILLLINIIIIIIINIIIIIINIIIIIIITPRGAVSQYRNLDNLRWAGTVEKSICHKI